MKGPHRKVVRTAVVDNKLFGKVMQGEESIRNIEAFLVFPMAALYLAVVPGCVRTNQFVLDTQALGCYFSSSCCWKNGW